MDYRILAIAQPLDPDRSSSPSLPGKQPVVDLTSYAVSGRWSHGTSLAGNGATVTLQMSRRQLKQLLPGLVVRLRPTSEPDPITNEQDAESRPQWGRQPNTGWWLLIHGRNVDDSKQGWSLTHVTDVLVSETVGGPGAAAEIASVNIASESFLSFLDRSSLQISATDNVFGLQGFVYQLNSWGQVMTSILGTLLNKPMGSLLEDLWLSLVRTRFPDSISQKRMGEFIRVVWNEETTAKYAPLRKGQCIAVPGNQRQHMSLPTGASVISALVGLFGADPRLVEMFPSFEPRVPGSSDLGEDSIGGRLCLVYRFKPVITAAISRKTIKDKYFRSSSPTACERLGIAQTVTKVSPKGFENAFVVPVGDVTGVDLLYSENNRCNLVYGAHFGPVTGNNSYGLVGSPLVRTTKTVEYHGLRPSTIRWPFFVPTTALARTAVGASLRNVLQLAFGDTAFVKQAAAILPTSDVLDYNNAITELAWAVLGEAEQYGQAVVSCRFRPWIRQGVWMTVYTEANGTLTGYVEQVTHSFQVEGEGSGAATSFFTSLTLSRVTSSPDVPEYAASVMTASIVPSSKPATLNFSLDKSAIPVNAMLAQAQVLANYDNNVLLADTQLTTDFVAGEFASKPDGTLPPRQDSEGNNLWNNLYTLAQQLQKIRDKTGKPITIVSGYRSKERNTKVGGAVRSQHLLAKAADIRIEGMALSAVYALLLQMIKDKEIIPGGLCLYPEGRGAFVHYDIRGKYTPFVPKPKPKPK